MKKKVYLVCIQSCFKSRGTKYKTKALEEFSAYDTKEKAINKLNEIKEFYKHGVSFEELDEKEDKFKIYFSKKDYEYELFYVLEVEVK